MHRRRLCLLLAAASLLAVEAGESCCARKARLAKTRFIPDPNDTPPDVDADGRPRWIPDPDDERPDEWDDDDDGPWEPSNIANPEFVWEPRLIANPDYKPPSFLEDLLAEVLKAAPWLVVGVAATAVLEAAALPLHKLAAVLSKCGPVGGALIGLATPLCSCGALPVAAGLLSQGVPLGAVVAFTTAAQSAGLDSAAITWGLLGPLATLCRLGGALVLATAAGLAAGSGAARRSSAASCAAPAPPAKDGRRLPAALYEATVRSATETLPPVLLGLAASTGAIHLLPSLAQAHESLGGGDAEHGGASGSLVIRAAVLLSSVPLQLCEHSTVTLAAAIQKGGGTAGLSFAFLLAAPSINMPSLLLLLCSNSPTPLAAGGAPPSRRWAAARVTSSLVAAALALSYAVDAAHIDLLIEREASLDGTSIIDLPAPLVHASPWVIGLVGTAALAHALAKRVRASPAAAAAPPTADCCAHEASPCSGKSAKKVD